MCFFLSSFVEVTVENRFRNSYNNNKKLAAAVAFFLRKRGGWNRGSDYSEVKNSAIGRIMTRKQPDRKNTVKEKTLIHGKYAEVENLM